MTTISSLSDFLRQQTGSLHLRWIDNLPQTLRDFEIQIQESFDTHVRVKALWGMIYVALEVRYP